MKDVDEGVMKVILSCLRGFALRQTDRQTNEQMNRHLWLFSDWKVNWVMEFGNSNVNDICTGALSKLVLSDHQKPGWLWRSSVRQSPGRVHFLLNMGQQQWPGLCPDSCGHVTTIFKLSFSQFSFIRQLDSSTVGHYRRNIYYSRNNSHLIIMYFVTGQFYTVPSEGIFSLIKLSLFGHSSTTKNEDRNRQPRLLELHLAQCNQNRLCEDRRRRQG